MTTTLYFRQGSSDKVYQASIVSSGDGWIVNFAYGRRGAALSTGTKTQKPVSCEEAHKIYDRLIASKTAKGYAPGKNAGTYTPPATATAFRAIDGIHPQLLNPVEESVLPNLLADPRYVLQPKHDGRRLVICRNTGTEVSGFNRNGRECGLLETIHAAATKISGAFILDGEIIGEVFHVFDVLQFNGQDLRGASYETRLARLRAIPLDGKNMLPVRTATNAFTKQLLFDRLRRENAEGVVFKRIDAPYTAGRPASGGDQLKFKFVTTASCIVASINARRSAALALRNGDKTVPAGNVTIPPNYEIPKVGQVVEVRYLYAMPDSGSLYQPVYLGVRDDIEAEECQQDKLKYKAAA